MTKSMSWLMVIISALMLADLPAQQKSSAVLNELVGELLAGNPQLQAARHKTAAARKIESQVTAWEPPQIGVEFYQTPVQSFPNPVKDGMETDYFIQQMLPFPGKLSAMGRAARENAEMTDQEFHALELKVIRQFKNSFYELYLIQQQININHENRELMKRFIDITLKQYEAGMGTQADILRAQTEYSSLLNEQINLQQEQQTTESMLNAQLNRPVDTPFGIIEPIEPDSLILDFDRLQAGALQNRPEVKAMEYNVAMNKSELSSSRREYFPDLMARLMYKNMADTKNDFWSLMIGVNLPVALWSDARYSSKVQESKLKVAVSEDELAAMKNMVRDETRQALIRLQSGYKSLSLYKNSSIPQAEQTLHSTLAAYQTGKTEFLMVIDAYRMLLKTRLDYQMALMNCLAGQAQLEQAVGMDMESLTALMR